MMKLAAVLAVLATNALAQDATLAKVSGPVSIKPQGAAKYAPAKGGEELLYGDSVRVGKGGVAHLTLRDRGAVLLRESTVMTLQGSPSRTTLNFAWGEFLVGLRKKLGGGESFRVRTPAAVAAVRGTLFWGLSDKTDKSTTYAGFGHTIEVAAQGKKVLVEAGMTVKVPYGSAPATVMKHAIPVEYANNFAIDGGIQDLGELVEADKLR
jgi:hypothetical protein